MNVVREIQRINDLELQHNLKYEASWHYKYKNSAYVFVAGLDHGLTEGDLICIFSQYGEIVDCNLVRDKKTGESRGFAFVAYEDTRSCVIAVDNFNGSKVLNRVMRVDHVLNYRRPKKEQKVDKKDEEKDDIELPSEDEDYDERRKAIWDYSLYQDRYEEVASDDDVPELDDEPVKAAEAPAPNAVQSHIDAVRAKRRARMTEAVNFEKQADQEEQERLKKREEARLAARKSDTERMLDALSSKESAVSTKKASKIDWKAVSVAAEKKQKQKERGAAYHSRSRSKSRSRSPRHSHRDDRRRSRSRSRDRERRRSRSRSRERGRVNDSKDAPRTRSPDRDRPRERDEHRRHRSRSAERRRSRSRDRERDRERDRDRDRR